MTQESPNQFTLDVEDIGRFTFRKRTLMMQAAIECEYARLTEGLLLVTPYLEQLAGSLADIRVLMVTGPKGWGVKDLDEMDADDPEVLPRLQKVWSALRDKQASFQKPAEPKEGGQGVGGDDRTLVPPDVPPGA